MSLRINTNVPAIRSANVLNSINNQLALNQERLATGYRINKAADDPAGLIIASRFAQQIAGTKAAQKNVENGTKLIETADKSLGIVDGLLVRAKELALSSMDGAKSDEERTANQQELNEIISSIDRIVDNTRYGSKQLLDGTNSSLTFQIGDQVGVTYDLTLNDMNVDQLGDGTNTMDGADVSTIADATDALATIEGAINQVATERGRLGGVQKNTFEATANYLDVQYESLRAAKASIDETDMAAEAADLQRNQVRVQVATMALQIAEQQPGIVLSLFG
jgi:flagellin